MKLPKRSDALLALGALLGIAIAVTDLVRAPGPKLPNDAVALVNGKPIRKSDYQSALAAVSADRRDGAEDPSIQRHVLDRLIDEELLVQAALELGLAERDPRVRADLTAAAIGFLTESPVADPSEAELAAFFAESSGYFARDARLEVRSLFFRIQPSPASGRGDVARAEGTALARAERARRDWLSRAPSDTGTPAADPAPLPLPTGLLHARQVEQLLGPSAARAALELREGGVSEPIRSAEGWLLVRLVRREGGNVPPLSAVRKEVTEEWRRRRSEQRLRQFLRERRERAKVVLDTELGS